MHINNSMTGNDRQVNKPFKDITKTGKTRQWREKKVANITYAELLQILKSKKYKEINKKGKTRQWSEKKVANITYAELLQILEFKKFNNVKQCGEVLEFKPSDTGHLKLYRAWFCKSKLCPVCNWRRAMKQS